MKNKTTPPSEAEKLSGGSVTFFCGHKLEIVAEMINGVKVITAPPTECAECARLIAAAPELLEASRIVRNYLEACKNRLDPSGVRSAITLLSNAIAKAEGVRTDPDEAA